MIVSRQYYLKLGVMRSAQTVHRFSQYVSHSYGMMIIHDEVHECLLDHCIIQWQVKTSQSKLRDGNLARSEETPSPTSHHDIVLDAMALLQTLTVAHNDTAIGLTNIVLKIIMKHSSVNNTAYVHWVCDTYPVISIQLERNHRMESAEGSFATTIACRFCNYCVCQIGVLFGRHVGFKGDHSKCARIHQYNHNIVFFLLQFWTF